MPKSEFAVWLERKYLAWQMDNGRASVREFSAYLGVNHALVVQWMNDKGKPGPKTLPILANKLGDEAYDLLNRTEEKPDPDLRRIIRNWDNLPDWYKRQLLEEIERFEHENNSSLAET